MIQRSSTPPWEYQMKRRENTRKFVTLSALIMQTYHCIHWRKKHASKGSSSPIVSLMLQPSTTLCFPTTQSVPLSTFFFPPFFFFFLFLLLFSPFSFFPPLFHLFPRAIGAFTLIKRPARDVYPGGVSVTSWACRVRWLNKPRQPRGPVGPPFRPTLPTDSAGALSLVALSAWDRVDYLILDRLFFLFVSSVSEFHLPSFLPSCNLGLASVHRLVSSSSICVDT